MLASFTADFLTPTQLPIGTVASRLLLALLLGGVIGWEREATARAAGLRTHMLISVAAALFAIIALELTAFDAADQAQIRVDPLRLIEAVTSGVAFLAAGSIVIASGHVRGVTTGASMWMVGAVGLCCGTGDARIAVLGTGLALVVLWAMRLLVERFSSERKREAEAEAEAQPADD